MAVENCRLTTGISNVCGDLLQASGVGKDIYVGYTSQLSTSISMTQTAAINALTWIAYQGLVKLSGQKFSHEVSYELAKAGGGALSYLHKITIRLMNLSTQDDVELQRLTQAQDAFFIFSGNNQDWYILGATMGMTADAGAIKTFGKGPGEDVISQVALTGNEKTIPLRFLVSDYATTVLYLENSIR